MSKRSLALQVIPHIRWHREGRQPFQRARLALVSALDELLELLSDAPEGVRLLLDGQAVLVEDYLELRPERARLVARLVKSGRLDVGPWYVAPDPFLASPEGLVRNLLLGSQICAALGGRLNVGYLPDTSGQIEQMPQILQGFGIESAAARNGLDDAPCELWWEAPNGSRVLLLYLRNSVTGTGTPSDGSAALTAALEAARSGFNGFTNGCVVPLMFGSDHGAPPLDVLGQLGSLSRKIKGATASAGSLGQVATAIMEDNADLPLVAGEMRSSHRYPIRAGALSARMPLKLRSHDVETLLERWTEPFSLWSSLLLQHGDTDAPPMRSQADPIGHAWRIVLQNHAVELAQGRVIDQVAHEIEARFDQAEQIAGEIVDQNLAFIAGQVDTQLATASDTDPALVVFNASSWSRSDTVIADTLLSVDDLPVEVMDDEGSVVPVELASPVVSDVPSAEAAGPLSIRFVAYDVPPFGYRTYSVRRTSDRAEDDSLAADDPTTIENEYLSVSVDPVEGTLRLVDKRTGRSFEGLNRFVDGGDRGDLSTMCPPARNTLIDVPTNTPLHVEREVGPVTQSLELFQIFRLPETLTSDRQSRLPLAAQFVPVTVVSRICIARGVPRVDFEVTVGNAARDHRLQVHFPTGIIAQEAFYDGHFAVSRRALAIAGGEETADWAEQPALEQPQRAFTTVLGDESSLTVAARGLPESAVLAGPDGVTIVLTLLRCVGWLSRDDLPNRLGADGPPVETPEAQCLGEHTFQYSLIPHSADPLPAWQQAWGLQTSLAALVTDVHAGLLAPCASLAEVDNPAFVLSAVKEAVDGKGMIVRGYNVSGEPQQVMIRTDTGFSTASYCRLDETPLGKRIKADELGMFTFEVGPGQIVTLRLSK